MAKQTKPKQPKQPKEAKKQATKEIKTEQQDNPHVIKHHNVLKSYS